MAFIPEFNAPEISALKSSPTMMAFSAEQPAFFSAYWKIARAGLFLPTASEQTITSKKTSKPQFWDNTPSIKYLHVPTAI